MREARAIESIIWLFHKLFFWYLLLSCQNFSSSCLDNRSTKKNFQVMFTIRQFSGFSFSDHCVSFFCISWYHFSSVDNANACLLDVYHCIGYLKSFKCLICPDKVSVEQYTFILTASKELPKQCIRYGTTTARYALRKNVGVRIPDDVICQAILGKMDAPLISTRFVWTMLIKTGSFCHFPIHSLNCFS